MPKGVSGGKRTQAGGGGGITLNLESPGYGGQSVNQIEQSIMSQERESVGIFGNDRKLITMEEGEGGEVTLSGKTIEQYKDDIRIMTHNHPVDLPLSTGDLLGATQLGSLTSNKFEELRAVSSNGNIYRALRPKNKEWPTEQQVSTSIQKNIRPAYERALQARRGGASKEDSFQIYQDNLTKRVAKDTSIRLKQTKLSPQIRLFNQSQIDGLRGVREQPTKFARELYGFGGTELDVNIQGEKKGSFPIFDTKSAKSALKFRRYAKTDVGLERIYKEASKFVPDAVNRSKQRDRQKSIQLRNMETQLRSLTTGKPTAESRRKFGFQDISGEKRGAFPIFDIESAKSALKLRGHAKTVEGRQNIITRAERFMPETAQEALRRDNISNVIDNTRLNKKSLRSDSQTPENIYLENFSPYKKFYRNNMFGVASAAYDTVKLGVNAITGKSSFKPKKYSKYNNIQRKIT